MKILLVLFFLGILIYPTLARGRHPIRSEEICTPGSRWKVRCNWCSCTSDGLGAHCTEKGCLPGYQSTGPVCIPGSRWKDECNWCTCGQTGYAGCTEKGCLTVGN